MKTLEISNKHIFSYIALVLAISPILDPYVLTTIAGLDFYIMYFIPLPLILLKIKISNNKIKANLMLLYIIGFVFILSLLSLIFEPTSRNIFMIIKNIIIWLFISIYLSFMWANCDYDKFIKYTNIIGIISVLLLFIQFLCINVGINNVFNGKIPFLNLSKYNDWSPMYNAAGEIRVHSFFQEPSYLCIFLLPLVAYNLNRGKYLKFIVFSLAIFISTSSVGVVGLLGIISYTLIKTYFKRNNLSNKIKISCLILLALLVCVVIYNKNPEFKQTLDFSMHKIMNIEKDLNSDRMGSTRLRLLGHVGLFNELEIYYKMFGLGAAQYVGYFDLDISYSSTIVTILLNYGIVGIFCFGVFIISVGKRYSKKSKVYLGIFIMVCFVDQMWFNWYFFYLLTWVICNEKINGGNNGFSNSSSI